MDQRALREALARALEQIPGVSVHSFVPANVNPPAVCVGTPVRQAPVVDLDDGVQVDVPIYIYVPLVDDLSTATFVDGLMSTEGEWSVKAALEADTTLGGVCDSVRWAGAEQVDDIEAPDIPMRRVVVMAEVLV